MRDPLLTDTPYHFPGQCVDGRQDGPVVDTFYEPPGYGRIYLSRPMVRDSARAFGPGLVDELAREAGYMLVVEHDAIVAPLTEKLTAALGDVEALERLTNAAIKNAAHENLAAAKEGAQL